MKRARGRKKAPVRPEGQKKSHFIVVFLLVGLTLAVYWQATGFNFQHYHDDEFYVTANQPVLDGLTGPSILWAFTSAHAWNWHPLTWMSHMLDVELYGVNPSGHHATSILLHIANTLLMLFLLKRMTGSFWKSGFVAALFALHPLHVESVAWVSERKDVLSTFFMLLTIAAYLRYVKEPRAATYLPVVALYALGLLAKPMLVTLPLLLLMLDWWPLRRFRDGGAAERIKEKIPLLVLAAGSCIVTFLVQKAGGALQPLEAYPLAIRLTNALVAYQFYIMKMVWPQGLAALYPHPVGGWPVWKVASSGAFLLAVTALVTLAARRRPYLGLGWLWYIVTLLPVIGLVQVGDQAYADRYTYIPLVGLFIIVAWGVPELASRFIPQSSYHLILSVSTVAVILVLSGCSIIQVGYWKDSVTLFERAIAVVPKNFLAEHELGFGYARDRRFADALPHLLRAVELKPAWSLARFNYAAVLYYNGNFAEAARELTMAERYGFKPETQPIREFTEKIRRQVP